MSLESRGAARFGWWSSVIVGALTAVTFAVSVGTPPLSGGWCQEGCFQYPFLDVGSRYPRDYYWMYLAMALCVAFVAFMLSLRARAVPARQLFGQLGVTLGSMAALVIGGDYFVQVASVQPSLLAGEADGVSFFTQYNPHGLFIALEELGYLLMSGALACAAVALPRTSRLERVARRVFFTGFGVGAVTLAAFMATTGHARGYFFEIAIISVAWLTLLPGAGLMAVVFRREAHGDADRSAADVGHPLPVT